MPALMARGLPCTAVEPAMLKSSTLCGSKPGLTLQMCDMVRIISPAEAVRTSARATSVTTSPRWKPWRPVLPRAASFSVSFRSDREICSAGVALNSRLAKIEMAKVNASTVASR